MGPILRMPFSKLYNHLHRSCFGENHHHSIEQSIVYTILNLSPVRSMTCKSVIVFLKSYIWLSFFFFFTNCFVIGETVSFHVGAFKSKLYSMFVFCFSLLKAMRLPVIAIYYWHWSIANYNHHKNLCFLQGDMKHVFVLIWPYWTLYYNIWRCLWKNVDQQCNLINVEWKVSVLIFPEAFLSSV